MLALESKQSVKERFAGFPKTLAKKAKRMRVPSIELIVANDARYWSSGNPVLDFHATLLDYVII